MGEIGKGSYQSYPWAARLLSKSPLPTLPVLPYLMHTKQKSGIPIATEVHGNNNNSNMQGNTIRGAPSVATGELPVDGLGGEHRSRLHVNESFPSELSCYIITIQLKSAL